MRPVLAPWKVSNKGNPLVMLRGQLRSLVEIVPAQTERRITRLDRDTFSRRATASQIRRPDRRQRFFGECLRLLSHEVWKRLLRLQRLGYVQLRSEQQVTIVSIVPPLGESPSKEQPSPTQGPTKCRAKVGQGTQIKIEDTDQKDKRNKRGNGRSSDNNDEQDRDGDAVIPSLEQIVSQIRSYIVDIARSSDSRFDDRIAQVAILRQRMDEIKQQNEARLVKGELTKESRQWYEGLRQFNDLKKESDNLGIRNSNHCDECGLSAESQMNLAREFHNWIIGPKGRAILRDSDWRSEVNKWTQREISTRHKRREMRSRSG